MESSLHVHRIVAIEHTVQSVAAQGGMKPYQMHMLRLTDINGEAVTVLVDSDHETLEWPQ